jgi:Uma2 family endonuclease
MTSQTAAIGAEEYFDLVRHGVVAPDDRVELLEGVIVTMSPQSPRHASAMRRVARALRDALGASAVISVQSPLVAGHRSVPEPDVAVLPGTDADYDQSHPREALLVVEVADSSLVQDRLTKASIYAAAGIPEYWIVNLRDDVVEVFRSPDVAAGAYGSSSTVRRGECLEIAGRRGSVVAVGDLLPAV